MAREKWVKTVTVTVEDLAAGDWASRENNPIALAIARALRPGVTLFVDGEEFYIRHGTHWEWDCLPDSLTEYASRVIHQGHIEELTVRMRFEPWALVTERSGRKGGQSETGFDAEHE